jgi:hypothetical protein
MKSLVEKSPHYNNFSYTGNNLVNGSPKETMMSHEFNSACVMFEDKEIKGNRIVFHYPDASSSLYLYKDGSYGVVSG